MKGLYRIWEILAEVMGDRDYARYRAHLARRHPGRQPLRPADFYVLRLKEKYKRPTRCC
jgi:uncharacterized short protein YbdD (DUF466 family)